jgi:hypothetical protein
MDAKPPGSIGPDGRCVSCAKRVQTTGGCMDCQVIMRSYTPLPSITITPAFVVAPDLSATMCPHARRDWRQCPHCLGINSNGGTQ